MTARAVGSALAAVLFVAVVALLATLIPSVKLTAGQPAQPPTAFGAYVQASGSRPAAVTAFEQQIHASLAVDQTFIPRQQWGLGALPAWDVAHGKTPLITFGSRIPTAGVVTGADDPYFAHLADQIAALHHPVLLRYAHEMDGRANASWVGTSAQFIAAWRHVWALFRAHGVRGSWIWEPNASGFAGAAPASVYWPGGRYVDQIGADGYAWGNCRGGTSSYPSFAQIFGPFYRWGVAHHKPLIITEFGAVELPGHPYAKANWDRQAARALASMPAIRTVVYFDAIDRTHGRSCDWRPDTSPQALAAFRVLATS